MGELVVFPESQKDRILKRISGLVDTYTRSEEPKTFKDFDEDVSYTHVSKSVPVENDMLVTRIEFTKDVHETKTEYVIALMGHDMLPTANMADGVVNIFFTDNHDGSFNELFDATIADATGDHSYGNLASVDNLLQTIEGAQAAGKF